MKHLIVPESVSVLLHDVLGVDFSQDVPWPEDQLTKVLSRHHGRVRFEELPIGC